MAISARSWWPKAPTPRIGCSTIPIGRTGGARRRQGPAQLHVAQSPLLPPGTADAPHDSGWRSRRDPGGPRHLLPGLAALRYRSEELVALAAAKGLRNCTSHNLRYYPLVQQMRRMIQDGDLGEILVAQGTYSQDWLLYDTDRKNWWRSPPPRACGTARRTISATTPWYSRCAA